MFNEINSEVNSSAVKGLSPKTVLSLCWICFAGSPRTIFPKPQAMIYILNSYDSQGIMLVGVGDRSTSFIIYSPIVTLM